MAQLVSSTEFARGKGLSAQRIRQLLAAGKIAGAVRIAGRWVLPADAPIRRTPAGRPPRTRSGMLRLAARACDAALAKAGIRALVVGSLAYGGVHPESDLDLLIVSHPGRTWREVDAIASEAAASYGVPIDLIFADTLPTQVKRALLKDARRASVV